MLMPNEHLKKCVNQISQKRLELLEITLNKYLLILYFW